MTKAQENPTLARWLPIAVFLALANGAWSIFLWQQLLVARLGGEAYCALGGGGCTALWDGAFASQVHSVTGLPVAAWGAAWSGAAALLSFLAWRRVRAERKLEPLFSACVWAALAGVASVPLLLVASAAAGEFCSNCAITYVLVSAFAGAIGIASAGARRRSWAWGRGAGVAALATAGFFLLFLYPGRATPRAGDPLGTGVLAAVQDQGEDGLEALPRLFAELSPRDRQNLANARALYAEAPVAELGSPRALVGPADAALRITTFTDSGCSHCATFHRALEQLLSAVPPGRVAIEQRVFPLDHACNPVVKGSGREEICLAAQVRVCLEEDPRALELAGWLHEEARPLSAESVYRVAGRLSPRESLERCTVSPETAAKIRDDIRVALEAGLQGTPFVLANGKASMPFAPFLYALALTGGDPDHEVFADLPRPRLADTASGPGHEGHDH